MYPPESFNRRRTCARASPSVFITAHEKPTSRFARSQSCRALSSAAAATAPATRPWLRKEEAGGAASAV